MGLARTTSSVHNLDFCMIKSVLVCLEGSASSEAAVRVALAIAKECEAAMTGLAIVDEPDIRSGSATSIGASSYKHERDETLVANAHKDALAWVAVFRRKCQFAGIPSQSMEVVGKPVASIVTEMQHHDLTVIGRDANFRYSTQAEDAQTREAILHRAPRPILIVPENAPAGGLSRTVLIAYDGSGAARRAMLSFAGSGLARSRDVHVATVDEMGDLAWRMANRGVQILREVGIHATLHNLVSPLPNADALFEHGKKLKAGLMVMGAFSRSRLAEFFTQSATRSLVEKSVIPLYMQH